MRSIGTAACFLAVIGIVAAAAGAETALCADGAELQTIQDGLGFGEGPAADAEGNVYFTDVWKSKILQWRVEGGVRTVHEETGGANGLMVDRDGSLVACEMRNRCITRRTADGTRTVVAERCEGKRFNQPNDLWIDSKGGIYFTDPIYAGGKDREIETEDVYYIAPGGGEVRRAATDLVRPNGIIGTPDGKTLYVADHAGKQIYAYDIGPDAGLSKRRAIIERGSDGMALDSQGNLYLTGGPEVEVFSPEGARLGAIPVPKGTTNVTFGGPERRTLFITTMNAVYAIEMKIPG